VTGPKRSPLFPEIPTMAQAGVPGFEVTTWWGILAPARTPAAVVEKLNQVINDAAASDTVRGRLERESAEPLRMTASGFGKALSQELTTWRTIASKLPKNDKDQ
jgi:tripartite-type tricarboxylate transporter receptor subunit TctC